MYGGYDAVELVDILRRLTSNEYGLDCGLDRGEGAARGRVPKRATSECRLGDGIGDSGVEAKYSVLWGVKVEHDEGVSEYAEKLKSRAGVLLENV